MKTPTRKRTTVPLHLRALCLMICLCLVMVDSYIPRNPLPKPKLSLLKVSSTPDYLSRTKPSVSFKDPSYIQWSHQKDLWKMQTAVTTFQRGDQIVELHAQQHYGDTDYFQYWNSQDFNEKHDCVLFELLVDDQLLEYNRGNWCVTQPIMASANDQQFALNLGLQCQASIIDYTNRKWAHADLSRQEFQKLAASNGDNTSNDTPLWKLASPESSSTAAEVVAALMVGPPTLDYSASSKRKRRLFTNLFLPGGTLANSMRAMLWMTVPAPELSIILLDWSSLLQGGNISALSEVALPILTSLVKFDISQMRRFLFGQVLVSQKNNGKKESSNLSWNLLVIDRNDHALQELKRKLEKPNMNSCALLYGSSHCPDLHNKLMAMGFSPTKMEWRTAWSVQESTSPVNTKDSDDENSKGLPALSIFLVFYLIIGALDWVGIVGDTSSLVLDANYLDASIEVGAYLVRHVLLYLGLSKFLIDWTNTSR